MPDIVYGFDSNSASAIAKLFKYKEYLNIEMGTALTDIGPIVTAAAVSNTWSAFKKPTGQLASTLQFAVMSPEEIDFGATSPYSRRMEEGFMGLTDSLGRTFNEAAEPYLVPAIVSNGDMITTKLGDAVTQAINDAGGM